MSPPAASRPSRPLFTSPKRLDIVDSTNAHLVRLAIKGAPEGTAVVADSQSAGRGRLGRAWLDVPGGSVLCSLLFRPRLAPTRWFILGWLVAVAAAQAVESATGVDIALKWPNDLVVSTPGTPVQKVGGVLSESVPPDAVVVGIGINGNWPPAFSPTGSSSCEDGALEATSLDRLAGEPVNRAAIEAGMLCRCAALYRALESSGEGAVAALYRQRLATIGRPVSVQLPGDVLKGRALGLDDDGRLLVDLGDCVAAVDAGDVFHLR